MNLYVFDFNSLFRSIFAMFSHRGWKEKKNLETFFLNVQK